MDGDPILIPIDIEPLPEPVFCGNEDPPPYKPVDPLPPFDPLFGG